MMTRIATEKKLPFELLVPNTTTIAAMKEARAGKLKSYATVQDMLADVDAQARGTSVNRLVDEMATAMLAEYDAETRFLIRANRGKGCEAEGLALLAKAAGESANQNLKDLRR